MGHCARQTVNAHRVRVVVPIVAAPKENQRGAQIAIQMVIAVDALVISTYPVINAKLAVAGKLV